MTPLERVNALPKDQQTAFLALFAGARRRQLVSIDGETGQERFGDFGKAECGWVTNRRDFYQRLLPELGLIVFTQGGASTGTRNEPWIDLLVCGNLHH